MLLKKLTIIFSVISLLFITGCHSYKSDLEEANDLYKKRNYSTAKSLYVNITKNCDDKKILSAAKEKLGNIDDLIKRKEISDKYKLLFEKSTNKYPTMDSNYKTYELIAYKHEGISQHYAIFVNDKTKEDIILEAFRWHNLQMKNSDCLVYFVNNKTYTLNRQKAEDFYYYFFKKPELIIGNKKDNAKNVIATYCQFMSRSELYFYDSNGDVTEKIDIWL